MDSGNRIRVKKDFDGWLADLDLTKIDLGKGKRSIVKNGVYNAKYQITIPRDLANYE